MLKSYVSLFIPIVAAGFLYASCQNKGIYDPSIEPNTAPAEQIVQGDAGNVTATEYAAVKCSSFISGNEAGKAFDGSTSSFWQSQNSSPQWINIDFGYSRDFNQVKIFWGSSFAKKFTINISSDGSTWTTVYTGGATKYGWQVITLSQTMKWARYAGVYCYDRSQNWGNQIIELKVVNASYYSYYTDPATGKKYASNTADISVLVNKDRNLSSTYVPSDLSVPNVTFAISEYAEKKNMRREAGSALEKMFLAAQASGLTLVAVSGYRSYATQQTIFNNKVSLVGFTNAVKVSAQPGQSEHQTGLAMDVSCWSQGAQLTTAVGDTPEGKWLAQNAKDYGFIIRYQLGKETITGYSYEPWHVRYVGVTHAKAIAAGNLTLEEYLYRIANN